MNGEANTFMHNALNIIVVEDHDALRRLTVEVLTRHGHNVLGVDCAEAMPDQSGLFAIDLMVIDLNLPGEDGLSLAARIRAAQPGIGIIMVTARNLTRDRLDGYENGTDIYLTKPISSDELLAAVRVLTRRMRPEGPSGASFRLSVAKLCLQGPEGKVSLSGLETAVLAAFVRAKDQQLESWQLIELAEKQVNEASKRALEVQIVRLRKKLEQSGADKSCIKALRGRGYRLCLRLELSAD